MPESKRSNPRGLENYSAAQVAQVRDAIYKISDAHQSLKILSESLAENNQWWVHGDIIGIVDIIDEHVTGKEGCLNFFLKLL